MRRCVATLSSALSDAVRHHRLAHNPARYANIARPHAENRPAGHHPSRGVPTALRPGSRPTRRALRADHLHRPTQRRSPRPALGRRRHHQRLLFVRYTLSNINNTAPVFTTPKTKSSIGWVGLSQRATHALTRQAERQQALRRAAGPRYQDQDLVFTRRNGQPLRPEYVLHHLHQLTADAGLPRIRVHDLRHFAATTMLSSQVPLAMASKTMRHSTLSTTTEIYGHLLRHAANKPSTPSMPPSPPPRTPPRPHDDHAATTR